MHKALAGGILVLCIALLAAPALAQGCGVATSAGWLADADCDSAPDAIDNCPGIPNSNQADANRNGAGDACDAVIGESAIRPDAHVKGGEIARYVARIGNNRAGPIPDLVIAVRNTELGIDVREEIGEVALGQSADVSLYMRVPRCAAAKVYRLSVASTFTEPSTGERTVEEQSVPLTVERSDACTAAPSPFDETIVSVPGEIGIDRGEGVVIPITITNLGEAQRTYHVATDDLQGWASWRIDPPSVIVPAGSEGQLALYIESSEEGTPGLHTVHITVTTENKTTTASVDVLVRAPLEVARRGGAFLVQAALVLGFLIIAIVLIALIARRYNNRHRGMGEHAHERSDSGDGASIDESPPPVQQSAPMQQQKRRTTVKIERTDEQQMETYY
jgi:hypothetical protein